MTVVRSPLKNPELELSIPEEVSLRFRPRQLDSIAQRNEADDEASITSEISLDLLAKGREHDEKVGRTCSSSWNPDGSDYSLDILLGNNIGDEHQSCKDDSAKESLMTSDYSLNIRLSKSHHSIKTTMSSSMLGTSQHSTDSISTFATTKTNKSTEVNLSEETGSMISASRVRKVSFLPRVRIHRVPNRKSMARAVRGLIWYDRADFKIIRQECFDTIELLQRGDLVNEDEGMCPLGLEYKTAQNYRERQRNKREVRQVVFDEQEFQRENSLNEPEWISRVSREQSRSCTKNALDAARKVEEGILQYLGLDDRYH